MSNKVSTSEKKNFYARFVKILIICWVIVRGKFRSQSCFLFVFLFFFAVKNCALKNSLEKNLTIK